jgi:hypothetical protein
MAGTGERTTGSTVRGLRTATGLLAACVLLCASPPARAQEGNGAAHPPAAAEPVRQNVLRLDLGLGIGSEGWGCRAEVDLNPYYACNAWTFGGYLPFIVGVGLDLRLDGPSFLAPGLHVMLGSLSLDNAGFSNTTRGLTVWEPYLDYVFKFGGVEDGTRGRVRAGAGLYLGGGLAGGALRIGGGASFLNRSRVGVGVDLVLEGGAFGGYWVSTIQLVVSPEFRLW